MLLWFLSAISLVHKRIRMFLNCPSHSTAVWCLHILSLSSSFQWLGFFWSSFTNWSTASLNVQIYFISLNFVSFFCWFFFESSVWMRIVLVIWRFPLLAYCSRRHQPSLVQSSQASLWMPWLTSSIVFRIRSTFLVSSCPHTIIFPKTRSIPVRCQSPFSMPLLFNLWIFPSLLDLQVPSPLWSPFPPIKTTRPMTGFLWISWIPYPLHKFHLHVYDFSLRPFPPQFLNHLYIQDLSCHNNRLSPSNLFSSRLSFPWFTRYPVYSTA